MRLNYALTIAVAACLPWACTNSEQATTNAIRPPDAVDVIVVQTENVNNVIQITGTLMPNEEIDIRAEIGGRVLRLPFSEGSKVSKGALLVKIDDSELQAELQKTKALVDLAEKDKARKKQLLDAKGISQEEYEQAETRLNELKAEVAVIESKLRNANTYAPFSGTVGLRYASEGAYATQGQVLALLVQTDPMKVEFGVPQRYAAFIKKGMKITFVLDGYTEVFEGEVYAYEPRIDASTRTLKVRAMAQNKEEKLIPGAFVEVKIMLQSIGDAVMIPSQALVPQITGQKVFVLKNGIAESREVEVGIRTETHIQITSGLSAGDTLVTTALLAIKAGSPIQVRNVIKAKQ